MIIFSFLFLAMTCISCSSNRVTTADDQLSASEESSASNESVTEGSTSNNDVSSEAEVSEAAQEKAKELLDGATASEPTASNDAVDPLTLGTESAGGLASLDGASTEGTLLAQADTKPVDTSSTPSLLTVPAVDIGGNNIPPAAGITESVMPDNNNINNSPVKKHSPKRAVKPAPVKPNLEEQHVEKEQNAPIAEKPVAQADVDEAVEPIPAAAEEKQEPKLASAEISTFIEKHVFLVTVGVVGFVFALFIIMRRNKGHEDNLTL